MMRYQQLRVALGHLSNAGLHLFHGKMPTHPAHIEALMVLQRAARSIQKELQHPERFNADGSPRMMSVWKVNR